MLAHQSSISWYCCRIIYIVSTAVLAGLGITTGFWFAPKLYAAITQATYVEQFCLVLSTNSSSGCVQVSKPQSLYYIPAPCLLG